MHTRLIAAAVATALLAQPAAAQDSFLDRITNEDIGRVLGGVGGALLGSQFGSGTGKLVAVAAGTIGGLFIGGEVGKHLDRSDRQGIANTSQQALETKQTQTWTNPDTGVRTTASVQETSYRPAPVRTDNDSHKRLVWQVPTMQLVGRDYVATTTSNVRGGPSTEYGIMGQLARGERVHVVGKVADRNWYLISRNGVGSGFVFGDLIRPATTATAAAGVPRPTSTAAQANVRECSVITQRVEAPNGATETRVAQACKRPDGTWEIV